MPVIAVNKSCKNINQISISNRNNITVHNGKNYNPNMQGLTNTEDFQTRPNKLYTIDVFQKSVFACLQIATIVAIIAILKTLLKTPIQKIDKLSVNFQDATKDIKLGLDNIETNLGFELLSCKKYYEKRLARLIDIKKLLEQQISCSRNKLLKMKEEINSPINGNKPLQESIEKLYDSTYKMIENQRKNIKNKIISTKAIFRLISKKITPVEKEIKEAAILDICSAEKEKIINCITEAHKRVKFNREYDLKVAENLLNKINELTTTISEKIESKLVK